MRKILILTLFAMIWTLPSYAKSDEPDPWAEEDVQVVEASEIINMDRIVDYDAPINRQMYAYMIYQLYEYLSGAPIIEDIDLSKDNHFIDLLDEGDSLLGEGNNFVITDNLYLRALKGAGLIEGYPDGTFKPTDYITREEIMTLYVRLIESLGYEMEMTDVVFEDEGSISDWSLESVKKCYATGLIRGVGNNTLNPKGYATMQETLVVMSRVIESTEFMAKSIEADRSAKTIVSNGSYTYATAFDLYGKPVGIDRYEDYTYIEQVYTGDLGNSHLFMVEDTLYFFDANKQLHYYDGEVKQTKFMTTYDIDGWYVDAALLNYQVEGLWLAYDLTEETSVSGTQEKSLPYSLDMGVLKYGDLTIEQSVVSYGFVGSKVFYLMEDDQLFGYDLLTGHRTLYGSTTAYSIDASWNYLILEETMVNDSVLVRYLPLFALEDYLN